MKGIILAGGGGTRLYPLTYAISKQMLPVYDKPMIYYPLDVLLRAGIRDILIISTREDTPRFMYLFGSGEDLGIHIEYKIQPRPEGLAQAFILGKNFISNDNVALILGDNIFFGSKLDDILLKAEEHNIIKDKGALLFTTAVKDPERFGVVELDEHNKVLSIEEKPNKPKSNLAVTGLYFYNNNVAEYAQSLKPSARGELEITDLNNIYLKENKVEVIKFPSSVSWLDAGTHDSLLNSSVEIQKAEKKFNVKFGCIEQTVFRKGWISKEQLYTRAKNIPNSYGKYLLQFCK